MYYGDLYSPQEGDRDPHEEAKGDKGRSSDCNVTLSTEEVCKDVLEGHEDAVCQPS